MVSYKSVFKAIFRTEHAGDTAAVPYSSKSRTKPSRAFTLPASPARPKTLMEQPVAGPSAQKHLNPYANNSNRHSAVALRDIISPRPQLRKNSLPSQFREDLSTLPPRDRPLRIYPSQRTRIHRNKHNCLPSQCQSFVNWTTTTSVNPIRHSIPAARAHSMGIQNSAIILIPLFSILVFENPLTSASSYLPNPGMPARR
jgi:hypothetical protein